MLNFINTPHNKSIIFQLFKFISCFFVPILIDIDRSICIYLGAG